jgi:hypothetical protein
MKKTLTILGLLLLTATTSLVWQGCKKKDNTNVNVNTSTSERVLQIQTGAQIISPDESITYNAVLVDAKGNTTPVTNVTWSTSNSLGKFTNNVFKPDGSGYGTITATATVDGTTFTAKVSLGVYLPAVFSVVPGAIVWTTGAGTIPLTTVYLGTGAVSSYTYSSSDASIASVDNSGVVSFNKTGECLITVTANGLSGNNKVYVPVLVVGMPTVPLPVIRVAVNPAGKEMFRGETFTFTAKAYNSSNAEVANSTFSWASQDPSVATIDATGKVTAVALGKTIITATSNGISGQAEVDVLPDTAIIVTPIMASLSPNTSKQFTATAYAVNHSTRSLSAIAMPAGLQWEVPTTGISMFDIATVDGNGLVTMKSSATVGMSTVVIAHVTSPTIAEGAGLVMVSDCNCGTTTPGVTAIQVSGGATISVNMMSGPITINAVAVDAGGNPVTGATLTYCSDNMAVVNVSGGTIMPSGIGTATLTICNGSVQTTITVNVTL